MLIIRRIFSLDARQKKEFNYRVIKIPVLIRQWAKHKTNRVGASTTNFSVLFLCTSNFFVYLCHENNACVI